MDALVAQHLQDDGSQIMQWVDRRRAPYYLKFF